MGYLCCKNKFKIIIILFYISLTSSYTNNNNLKINGRETSNTHTEIEF